MQHKPIISLIAFITLAACTIASPLTTTHNWLEALKNKQYDQAAQYLANPIEPKQLETETANRYGAITSFTVDNSLAMSPEELKSYNTPEGYTVFYTQESTKGGHETLKVKVIKKEGVWKILYRE